MTHEKSGRFQKLGLGIGRPPLNWHRTTKGHHQGFYVFDLVISAGKHDSQSVDPQSFGWRI
ncbi:hypothetical protein [Planctopirus limnophila]|uniref:hypothetical protein n=1 Tax=Planctopirus limnophila TaxID=120 RepID=UPI0001A309B9|nr:hypothetical protein [Planctopirus limnophila]